MAAAESKLWYLEQINIFRDLGPDDLDRVDKISSMKTLEKGKFIYFPEEPSKVVFLLKSGRVKIGTYSEEGKEITKAILEPGEIFGELAIAGQEKRQDFAQVLDNNVKICAIHKEEMLKILESMPRLNLKITHLIGVRLQKMERRFESLIFKDARDRIVDFIRDLVLNKGKKVGFEYAVKHKLTHQDMANLTATSRQTVTIVLNELREQGILDFDRRSIIVHEMDDLV
ncbi:Crp/Fnr family transcriptional regulator [bacterium SCSIO 12643]|nr:Crp/Fnr family transcriptional regulator [bacterium SCSIO 12643]